MPVVSSTTAWHQSSRVAATVRSPFVASVRLDAAAPLAEIVARLNRVQPQVMIGYASMIRAPGAVGGVVRVHPVVFHRGWTCLDAAGRQVRQGEHDLTVLLAGAGPGVDVAAVDRSVRVALAAAGVRVPVTVAVVDDDCSEIKPS